MRTSKSLHKQGASAPPLVLSRPRRLSGPFLTGFNRAISESIYMYQLAGSLVSLGLALPTGMAFGYGYGYGVRAGYHAFKPSQNSDVTKLHLSPNPVEGATGAGLFSAEEMTGHSIPSLGLTDEPSLTQQVSKVVDTNPQQKQAPIDMNSQDYIQSPLVGIAPRHRDSFKDHQDFVDFVKGKGKYLAQSKQYQQTHRLNYAKGYNRNRSH